MYKPEIISNAEYHGRKTHLSSTNVRTFDKNKKQFKYGLTHELVKQTKAMADGTAVHSFFLERRYLKNSLKNNIDNVLIYLLL